MAFYNNAETNSSAFFETSFFEKITNTRCPTTSSPPAPRACFARASTYTVHYICYPSVPRISPPPDERTIFPQDLRAPAPPPALTNIPRYSRPRKRCATILHHRTTSSPSAPDVRACFTRHDTGSTFPLSPPTSHTSPPQSHKHVHLKRALPLLPPFLSLLRALPSGGKLGIKKRHDLRPPHGAGQGHVLPRVRHLFDLARGV